MAELDPASAAYEEARRLASEGAYAEALAKYEWFHEHGVTQGCPMGDLRLSVALASWVKLGEKYPPALDSLRRIRDANADAVSLPGSSDGLFLGYMAINKALGEEVVTMKLFREMEYAWPEFARRRFKYVQDRAFEMDLELFIQHTPDFVVYAEKLLAGHQGRVRSLSGPFFDSVGEDARAKAYIKNRVEESLRDCVTAILKLAGLAAAAGKDAAARKIAAMVVNVPKVDEYGRE